MDIIKAFEKNNVGIDINIQGTIHEPLFRASDIGLVLEISKIRNTVQDFDDTEKVARTVGTLGGNQEVTFLTEKGLYQVLFTSRKPIAKKFKNWVCEAIKEIRINGVYDLQKQLELKNKEIKDIHEGNIMDINDYAGKPVVYLLDMKEEIDGERLYRIGNSGDIIKRFNTHSNKLKDTKNDIIFKNCWDFLDISIAVEVETLVKRYIKSENILYKYRDNSTEIFKTNKVGIIESLVDKWKEECTETYKQKNEDSSIRLHNEKRRLDLEYADKIYKLIEKGVDIDKLSFYDKPVNLQQKVITPKNPPKTIDPDGVKCTRCNQTKSKNEYTINEQTTQFHVQCDTCRKKMSDKSNEKLAVEFNNHIEKYKETIKKRQNILDQEIMLKCFRKNCNSNKPFEFGLNRKTHQFLKVCRKCQGNEGLYINEYIEGILECSKCSHDFNIVPDTFFRQCENCREKWRLNNVETEETHKKKLLNKKEYYSKNKEEIRQKQKEYYDENH